MLGMFSPPLRFGAPDMHHGTSVTHVPWCGPGSRTSGFLWSQWRGKRSRHSRRMRNAQFYVSGKRSMTWGPWQEFHDFNDQSFLCVFSRRWTSNSWVLLAHIGMYKQKTHTVGWWKSVNQALVKGINITRLRCRMWKEMRKIPPPVNHKVLKVRIYVYQIPINYWKQKISLVNTNQNKVDPSTWC